MSPPSESNPNPRGAKRPVPPRRGFSPLWFGAVLFGLLLLVNVLASTLTGGQTIDYSDFKLYLQQGRLTEVTVSPERIRGKYLDPEGREKTFTTIPIEDPDLVKQLQDQKVRFTGEVR